MDEIREATPEELEPPWEELDPGIADVVRLLHEGGIYMYCSCEGGPRHLFEQPTVIVYDDHEKAIGLLEAAGHKVVTVASDDYEMTLLELRLGGT